MTIMAFYFLACSGETGTETDDSKGGGGGSDAVIEVAITSPGKGETYDYGSPITFTAEVTADGEAIDASKVTWSSGAWSDVGISVTTSDLPPGKNTVQVEAKVDGETYTDSVDVTVKDPPPLDYRGTANIKLFLQLVDWGDYDVNCPGNLTFTMTGADFSGTGSCTEDIFGETYQFTVDGSSSGGNIEGSLSLNIDGTDYPTPFTGTGAYNQAMDADFDETYNVDGNSIRVYGSWTANPVAR